MSPCSVSTCGRRSATGSGGAAVWPCCVTCACREEASSAHAARTVDRIRRTSAEEIAGDHEQISGLLRQSSHEPGIPCFAVTDQDARLQSFVSELTPPLVLDAVQHLDLEGRVRQAKAARVIP